MGEFCANIAITGSMPSGCKRAPAREAADRRVIGVLWFRQCISSAGCGRWRRPHRHLSAKGD